MAGVQNGNDAAAASSRRDHSWTARTGAGRGAPPAGARGSPCGDARSAPDRGGRDRPRRSLARPSTRSRPRTGRVRSEVSELMDISVKTIERELPDLAAQGVARAPSVAATARPASSASASRRSSARPPTSGGCSSGSPSTTAAVPRSSRPAPRDARGPGPRGARRGVVQAASARRRRCRIPTCSSAHPASPHLELPALAAGVLWAPSSSPACGPTSTEVLRSALEAYAGRRRRFGGR